MRTGKGTRAAVASCFFVVAIVAAMPAGASARRPGTSPVQALRSQLATRMGLGARTSASGGAEHGRHGGVECTVDGSGKVNVTLDCLNEYGVPTHEPSIAVDPTDPDHIVTASLNEIFPYMTIQVATSFDGGKTWTIGDLPRRPHTINWDPWVAFDAKRGTVALAFEVDDDFQDPTVCFQHQMITTSSDGGITWARPVMAVPTQGNWCLGPGAVFEEGKIAVDNDPGSATYGRMIVTALFLECTVTECRAPIAETLSDDGGATWTKPTTISGSDPNHCTSFPEAPLCDADLPPALATFAPDGAVYVVYGNRQNPAASEKGERGDLFFHDTQLMVVKSTDGGVTWAPPVHIVDVEDGGRDYVCSADYIFGCRLSGVAITGGLRGGYLAAAPDGTLYVVFSDNRNGRHDVANPVSNEDVFVMTSHDGGQTWLGPDLVAGRIGDEFNPAVSVNPTNGELGVLFYDRTSDPEGKTMEVSLAAGLPGSFDITRISTAPSHLNHDLWWAQTLPDCSSCVYHVGEYFGLAYGSDGSANMVWPDLRRFLSTPNGRNGYAMNVDFARVESNRPGDLAQ